MIPRHQKDGNSGCIYTTTTVQAFVYQVYDDTTCIHLRNYCCCYEYDVVKGSTGGGDSSNLSPRQVEFPFVRASGVREDSSRTYSREKEGGREGGRQPQQPGPQVTEARLLRRGVGGVGGWRRGSLTGSKAWPLYCSFFRSWP